LEGFVNRTAIGGLAVCALCAAAVSGVPAKAQVATSQQQEGAFKVEGFYCNINALTPAERAHHKKLTDKLMSARTETVETEKGYELQYRGGKVTVAELAEWTVMESKCCRFFDFHIDLEEEGKLMCLRLTGREGIKKFIKMEFGI
jgi:hypothetical protein